MVLFVRAAAIRSHPTRCQPSAPSFSTALPPPAYLRPPRLGEQALLAPVPAARSALEELLSCSVFADGKPGAAVAAVLTRRGDRLRPLVEGLPRDCARACFLAVPQVHGGGAFFFVARRVVLTLAFSALLFCGTHSRVVDDRAFMLAG